jgi:hypothetical protein
MTALWDRRFEHIAYLAVDSFAEGDNLEPDRMMDWQDIASRTLESARIDKDFDIQSNEEQALELNLAARLKDAGEAASQLALDPATKATLGSSVSLRSGGSRPSSTRSSRLLDAKRRGDVALIERALKVGRRPGEPVRSRVGLRAARKATAALRVTWTSACHQVELETA